MRIVTGNFTTKPLKETDASSLLASTLDAVVASLKAKNAGAFNHLMKERLSSDKDRKCINNILNQIAMAAGKSTGKPVRSLLESVGNTTSGKSRVTALDATLKVLESEIKLMPQHHWEQMVKLLRVAPRADGPRFTYCRTGRLIWRYACLW